MSRNRSTVAHLTVVSVLGLFALGSSDEPRPADLGVASIVFLDAKSAIARLGETPPMTGEGSPFQSARYVNDDRTETLTLIMHPGSIRMEFSEAIVELADPSVSYPRFPGGAKSFQTLRGIKLGMTRQEVEKILGSPDSETRETVRYLLDETNAKNWLARFNMPVYYGSYEFADGKLVTFSFGFEYP